MSAPPPFKPIIMVVPSHLLQDMIELDRARSAEQLKQSQDLTDAAIDRLAALPPATKAHAIELLRQRLPELRKEFKAAELPKEEQK